jgi:hypothetical protein
MNKVTFKFFYNCCKEKVDDDLRIAKTIKACNNFYKGIYYTIVVIWGYLLLKDEYFLPASLLGSGNLSDLEKRFPYHKQPDNLKYYVLATMGFHLFSFVKHAVSKARNDYMEMMLHHAATVLLYGFSYYCNRNDTGAIVMFLHDWADIPCGFTRCFTETIYQGISIFFGLAMAVLWFYTRLIVFPQVINAALIDTFDGKHDMFRNFSGFMLVCLLILHTYWFYILAQCILKLV